MRVAITGANGHLGLQLISRLATSGIAVRALVRSPEATRCIEDRFPETDVRVLDYADTESLGRAIQGCDLLVHLVGIVRETGTNTYKQAHETTCRAMVAAGLEIRHIICLGIVGTDDASDNDCLRSRARAESVLLESRIPTTIIRVPRVLGPGDPSTLSLARSSRKLLVPGFRTASLEQPIYSGDLIDALLSAIRLEPVNRVLNLAGPESLPREQLIKRAASLFGHKPIVVSLPLMLGCGLAFLLEKFTSAPPITRAMLGVLNHDDEVDNAEALAELGITLTSLDDTLRLLIK